MRNPWHKGGIALLAFLTVLAFYFVAIQPAPAQDALDSLDGGSCKDMKVRVMDSTGIGIPNATVTLESTWIFPTDFDGVARIQCHPGMRIPFSLEVAAHGFKRSIATVTGVDLTGTEVYLARERTELPSSSTVSARELSADAQDRSVSLQREANRALQQGNNEEAERLLREALELTPSSGAIYNNIGVTYLRRHRVTEAAEWFEKAVQMSPYDAQLVGNLGMIRWLQDRHEESYQLLDRAVLGGFSTPAAHFILGVVSLQKGRVARAVDQLRQTDGSKYPLRDLYLAIAFRAEGKAKAAAKSYEIFVRNNPAPLWSSFLPRSVDGQ